MPAPTYEWVERYNRVRAAGWSWDRSVRIWRARKVFQQQPENGWQVAMIERNGRLVLSVKPVPFVPSEWAA